MDFLAFLLVVMTLNIDWKGGVLHSGRLFCITIQDEGGGDPQIHL